MEEKVKFVQCPQCKGYIPETWKMHEKCGWNVPIKEDIVPQETEVRHDPRLVSMCVSYVKDLVCAGKVDMKDFEKTVARLVGIIE